MLVRFHSARQHPAALVGLDPFGRAAAALWRFSGTRRSAGSLNFECASSTPCGLSTHARAHILPSNQSQGNRQVSRRIREASQVTERVPALDDLLSTRRPWEASRLLCASPISTTPPSRLFRLQTRLRLGRHDVLSAAIEEGRRRDEVEMEGRSRDQPKA